MQAEAAASATPAVPVESSSAAAEVPPRGTRGTVALTGALVFAGWYGIAIGESYAWQKAPEAAKLRIPVVGPWLTVAHAGCAPNESGCTTALAVIRAIIAGVSAVGQVGGLAVIAESAFVPRPAAAPPKASVTPTFFAGPDSVGLGLSGAF